MWGTFRESTSRLQTTTPLLYSAALLVAFLVALFLTGPHSVGVAVENRPPAANQAKPQPLIVAALRSEIAAENEERQRLLHQAIANNPNDSLPHWYLGQVHFDGSWQTIEEIERQAASDPLPREYRDHRTAAQDTAAAHEKIAEWCLRKKLPAEEKAHWWQVLRLDPDHERAKQRLGLREFRGEQRLDRDIAAIKQREKQRRLGTQKWSPLLRQLKAGIRSDVTTQRKASIERLHAIDDSSVIAPLLSIFGNKGDLALEAIELLSTLPQPEAAEALVRYAVDSKDAAVRQAAAQALKDRSFFEYVPSLLAGLDTPLESNFKTKAKGYDREFRHVVTKDGPDGKKVEVRSGKENRYDAADAIKVLRSLERKLQKKNKKIRRQNERIHEILTTATGAEASASANDWYHWWRDYNEYETGKIKTVSVTNLTYDPGCQGIVISGGGGRHASVGPGGASSSSWGWIKKEYTCFAAGTPVWTIRGPLPIEHVKIGDRVLSQDPETGELAYKPVLATTLRPPVEMLKIDLGDHSILTTRGHPFWISGEGWKMAKFLESEQVLHGVRGGFAIRQITSETPQQAFNLIVDEFHTYFVGDDRLLCHDVTIRKPTLSTVPGMVLPEPGN